MPSMLKRYLLYLARWQLSTPILAICLITLVPLGKIGSTVVANLIGGLLFFWLDRFIFTHHCLGQVWESEEKVVCMECGKVERGFRLVCADADDREPRPAFRCPECTERRTAGTRRPSQRRSRRPIGG
jgi:hypothetical protein